MTAKNEMCISEVHESNFIEMFSKDLNLEEFELSNAISTSNLSTAEI